MTELYQGLLMIELYQGLYTVLAMDLYLLCKVEQKRKQSVLSGTNYKLITISITVFFFLVKRSYIYMILHRYF